MRRITVLLAAGILAFSFISCATNSELTDVLAAMAEDAKNSGDKEAAAFLGVASSISKAAEDITPENEYYIGRSVAATILQSYSIYKDDEKEAYVNKIAQSIIRNSPMPELYNGYHVIILDTDELNAFATSGGHIFVTKGLINCAKSEDALAAAIAHEISHIQLKHSSLAIKTSRYTTIMTKAAGAALTFAEEHELAEAMDDCVGGIVNDLVSNGYSKDQEFQADEYAMNLMAEAGYNPNEMLSLLGVMKEVCDAAGNTTMAMLKTHPEPKDRIKKAEKILKKMPVKPSSSDTRQARFDKIMHS